MLRYLHMASLHDFAASCLLPPATNTFSPIQKLGIPLRIHLIYYIRARGNVFYCSTITALSYISLYPNLVKKYSQKSKRLYRQSQPYTMRKHSYCINSVKSSPLNNVTPQHVHAYINSILHIDKYCNPVKIKQT